MNTCTCKENDACSDCKINHYENEIKIREEELKKDSIVIPKYKKLLWRFYYKINN